MDPLDKAFTVWLSPANGTDRPQAIHRRVDLIAAPARYYACAVLGWSGSTSMYGSTGSHTAQFDASYV